MRSLVEWLRWQESLHPKAVDLGLDRVGAVCRRLLTNPAPWLLVIVGGTNGKGSCIALLESILIAAGYRVGSYTSPHLFSYNERIRLNGSTVNDDMLCQAFQQVDHARQNVSLSYFEFGTLAALEIFYRQPLDIVLLEVGLGGRLDAVNVMDADVALITSIGIDHVAWLGKDRESIGWEKAGILRAGKPCVFGERMMPQSIASHARSINAKLHCAGQQYDWWQQNDDTWSWCNSQTKKQLNGLPWPLTKTPEQLQNAAAVLMVLDQLAAPVKHQAICLGLQRASVPGRLQIERCNIAVENHYAVVGGNVNTTTEMTVILDVAHNPQAVFCLAMALRSTPCQGKTLAIFGMLKDKDVAAVLAVIKEYIDVWHTVPTTTDRGLGANALCRRLRDGGLTKAMYAHNDMAAAWKSLIAMFAPGDRAIVFGSFQTVAAVMPFLHSNRDLILA